MNHIFYEIIISKEHALKIDFIQFDGVCFEVYGALDYLNDFYNNTMQISLIHERIHRSDEAEIGISFCFNEGESIPSLWKLVLDFHNRLSEMKLKEFS